MEFDILKALLSRPSVVFNREQIMTAAYQMNIQVSDRTIDSHIRNIRAKLAGERLRQCHRYGARRRFQAGPLRAPRMTPPTRAKWRPTLGLIVFAVLSTVIALPLVGLFFFRIYDNQLIHQTQAELIAQSSVLSAVYAREVEAKIPGIPLGAEIAPEIAPRSVGPFCADPAGARSCRQRPAGAAARCAAARRLLPIRHIWRSASDCCRS